MTLAHKKFLIVGGSSGIGRATALAAAEQGAQVTVTGRSAAKLRGLPSRISTAVLDYSDPRSIAALAKATPAIDYLVLSAADAVAWGAFQDMDEATLRAAFEGKFWGYWRVIRALVPKLSANSSVTLVTGAAARAALPGTSGLAAVNGALEAMAKVLAVELAPHRFNTVSPGMTATEAYAGMPEAARLGMFAATAAKLPSGRIGSAEDIAQAILLVASNPFMTGATLDIDGGAHLAQ